MDDQDQEQQQNQEETDPALEDESEAKFVDEFSSGEDEYSFEELRHDIEAICTASDCENSDEDDNVPLRKINIVGDDKDDSDDSDYEPEEPDEDGWKPCYNKVNMPPRIEFKSGGKKPGPNIPEDCKEPVDFFRLFFTDEMADMIIEETNKCGAERMTDFNAETSMWKTWYALTKDELWAFLGVVINMGSVPLARIQEYWATNPVCHIPFFCNTFTRQRFSQIFWMLRPQMPTKYKNSRLKLISGFLEAISSKLLDYYTPNEQLYINQSIFSAEGRAKFIRYNPVPVRKYSIRLYSMIDCSTGYLCGILPYYGCHTKEKLLRPDLPMSTRIPLTMYSDLLKKLPDAQGHHIFTDRVFTSANLADELYKLKCHLTGELAADCKRLLKGKTMVAYERKNNLILAWKEKKEVALLTNWHNPAGAAQMSPSPSPSRSPSPTSSRCPSPSPSTCSKLTLDQSASTIPRGIANYTKSMVSVAGSYTSQYCFIHATLKWWRKLFFWGLEVSLINAYILYRLVKKQRREVPVKHVNFKKTLVSQLRGDFRQQRVRIVRALTASDEVRLDGKLHLIYSGKKRDCRVCSKRTASAGRRETNHYCDTCPNKPRMHIGRCFEIFHTKVEFKNVEKKVHKMTPEERKKISGALPAQYVNRLRERLTELEKICAERGIVRKHKGTKDNTYVVLDEVSGKNKTTGKDKTDEKDKTSEKDKANEKDKTGEKEKTNEKDKIGEKDRYSGKNKTGEKDRYSGKNKTGEKDRYSGKNKTGEKDRYSGKNKTGEKDRYSGKNKTGKKDRYNGRDKTSEKDRYSGRDKTSERDSYSGRDKTSEKDRYSGKDKKGKIDDYFGRITRSEKNKKDKERGERSMPENDARNEKDTKTGKETNIEKDKKNEYDAKSGTDSGRKRPWEEEPKKILFKIPLKRPKY